MDIWQCQMSREFFGMKREDRYGNERIDKGIEGRN